MTLRDRLSSAVVDPSSHIDGELVGQENETHKQDNLNARAFAGNDFRSFGVQALFNSGRTSATDSSCPASGAAATQRGVSEKSSLLASA